MKRTKASKRPYESAAISSLNVTVSSPILAGSVANSSKIKSVGQEIGKEYDLGTGSFGGSSFNFDWESGN